MKTEKMSYVKPTVQKVEFDFKTRIANSTCGDEPYDEAPFCNFS
jgi:hypothetical protein